MPIRSQRIDYLGIIKLMEHLIVDLLNHIFGEVDRADPRHRGKSSSTYVRYAVIPHVKSPHEPQSSKSVRVQFLYLIAIQF